MFGLSTYAVNRKPYIMLYDGALVWRLFGEDREEVLSLPGARFFNPRNNKRPMANWVQLPADLKGHWRAFAERAHRTVPR